MKRHESWEEALPDLLARTYDAALDAAKWGALTARLGVLFGGHAVLFAQDRRSPAVTIFNTTGFDPGFIDSYVAHYARSLVWTPGAAAQRVGRVVTGDEIIDRASFDRSEWYNGWLRPQGLYHGTAAVLGNDQGVVTQLSVIAGPPVRAGDRMADGPSRRATGAPQTPGWLITPSWKAVPKNC